eukprot:s7_g23.t1
MTFIITRCAAAAKTADFADFSRLHQVLQQQHELVACTLREVTPEDSNEKPMEKRMAQLEALATDYPVLEACCRVSGTSGAKGGRVTMAMDGDDQGWLKQSKPISSFAPLPPALPRAMSTVAMARQLRRKSLGDSPTGFPD